MNAKESFGDRLKLLRGEKKQKELADALGISRASVGYYENGTRTPDIEVLVKAAAYFSVSTDYLLGLTAYKSLEERERDTSTICLLSVERKGQIEELTKKLIDCCLKHHKDCRFFPLWFTWFVKYLADSVDVFGGLLTQIEKNVPASDIGKNLAEITSLSHSLAMGLTNSYMENLLKKTFEDGGA